MADTPRALPPSVTLERVLVANFVVHAVAMVGMVFLLLASLPGGTTTDDAQRVARIASHPWVFRVGWVPWQLTAVLDLMLGIAILRTPWIPKGPAVVALLLTLAAVVPDQAAQAMLVTRGVALAQQAARSGDLGPYLAFEGVWFPRTAAWAACLYDASAVAWSIAFARAGTWSRTLTVLSIVAWTAFGVVSVGMLLPAPWRVPAPVVSAGNALGFVLFEAWILLLLDRVLRRSRPDDAHGALAVWRHPGGLGGRVLDVAANSRSLRALLERVPTLAYRSDITDVVYVNYLVPAERLLPLVPQGLELQRVGPGGAYAVFTHLTFNHGGFGPRVAGPLRRLLGSPVQSNWRIHVRDPRRGTPGIYFVTSAISSAVNAVAARLLTDGMPLHVPARAEVSHAAGGAVRVVLDPGHGSAPDVDATLRPAPGRALPEPWSLCFESYQAMLAYVVPQSRAMSTQPWRGTLTRHEIELGIPLEACEPLVGEVRSRAAERIVGSAQPLCFRVARVAFAMTAEQRDALQ
jgi:hypothetical protein